MQTAAQNAAYGQPGAANSDQADDAQPKKRPRGRPLGSKTKVRPPVPSVFSVCFLNASGQLPKVSMDYCFLDSMVNFQSLATILQALL